MGRISDYPRLVVRALFLRSDAYEEMRVTRNPFGAGLVIIVSLGVLIALLGLVGTVLEWAASPNMAAVQKAVYDGLIEMPWYRETARMVPNYAQEFERWYEWGWSVARWLWAPNLGSAAGNLVLLPLGFVVRWLIYGLLAHVFARLLKGQASLGQTLGCTALAVAPQLLRVTELLPFVSVGGVLGTWTLLCRYQALKQAHNLSWGRALAATLLPSLALWLLVLILASIGAAVLGAVLPQFPFEEVLR